MEMTKTQIKPSTSLKDDVNRDPITGEPGSHPVGVGIGGAGGAMAGAVIGGAVGGPIGAGVGALAGVVSGSFAGKGVAETFNPTAEHAFWRTEYTARPYFTRGTPYEQYGPAFQYGWESFANHKGKTFAEIEAELSRDWERHRKQSKLSWNHAKDATLDAWQRVEKAACGDKCL